MADPVSSMVAGGAVLAGAGLAALTYGFASPRSQWFGPAVWHGRRTGRPAVALTFDDGPHPQFTPQILEVLRHHQVPAAFFVIGRHVRDQADVLRSIHKAGHLIGNHTFDHNRSGMFGWSGYWRNQLQLCSQAIGGVVGVRPSLFRPPMGLRHHHVTRAVREQGFTLVTWSRRGLDGRATTQERIVSRLMGSTGPGDILLLHDGCEPGRACDRSATAAALDTVLTRLKTSGLAVEPLDELIGVRGYF